MTTVIPSVPFSVAREADALAPPLKDRRRTQAEALLGPCTQLYLSYLTLDYRLAARSKRQEITDRIISLVRRAGTRGELREGPLLFQICPAKIGQRDMTYFKVTSNHGGV